jgi:hypothetical protein
LSVPVEPDLRVFVSDVQIDIHCAMEEVLRGLRAVWDGCRVPAREIRARHVLSVRRRDVYRIERDGVEIDWTHLEADVLPLLEGHLYEHLAAWLRPGDALLHAGAVVHNGRPILLVGPSGAGKSSLTLAAVRQGWGYMTDELVVTNGAELWGVARAIQFDPVHDGAKLPPWLGGTNRQAYRFRGTDDVPSTLPLFEVPEEGIVRGSLPVARAYVVLLGRGEQDGVEPCSPLEALTGVHEAAFHRPAVDLGALTGAGCLRLRWRTGEGGVEALRAALDQPEAY